MTGVVRVLIGDDHRIVREGLKQVLGDPANGAPEITVVAEATQAARCWSRSSRCKDLRVHWA